MFLVLGPVSRYIRQLRGGFDGTTFPLFIPIWYLQTLGWRTPGRGRPLLLAKVRMPAGRIGIFQF